MTQRDALGIVAGCGMAARDGGSVQSRHLSQIRVGVNKRTIRRAREYHRRHPIHLTNGFYSPYDHSNVQADEPTTWDDATFVVNDYRVALSWVHPRYVYKQLVYDLACWRRPRAAPFR